MCQASPAPKSNQAMTNQDQSKEESEPATTIILEPRKFDILCGKDKQCVGHVGSKRFRAIIESYRHRYSTTNTKYEKMMITKEIYERLDAESCRFLRYNSTTGSWEELPTMAARDKVGHALRFANRTTRRRRKRQPQDDNASMASWEEGSSNSNCNSNSPASVRRMVSKDTVTEENVNIMALLPELTNSAPVQLQERSVTPPEQLELDSHDHSQPTSFFSFQEEESQTPMPSLKQQLLEHEQQSFASSNQPVTAMSSIATEYWNMVNSKSSSLLLPQEQHQTYMSSLKQQQQQAQSQMDQSQHQQIQQAMNFGQQFQSQSYQPQAPQPMPQEPELIPHMDDLLLPLLSEPVMDWDLDFEISPNMFSSNTGTTVR